MIIDVHTHTPRFPKAVPDEYRSQQFNAAWNPGGARPVVYTWAEYEEALKPVERAIVFNIAQAPPGQRQVNEPYIVATPQVNDETAAFVRSHPEKYIGFLTVHPDALDARDEMERCVSDLGMRGVKLGLNYQNVDPLSENARKVYRFAEERSLPMLIHQGTSPVRFAGIDYAHPRHTDQVAIDFPELRIIMAHIGHPFCTDALMVARKHPNVWLDVSGAVLRPWGLYQALVTALEWGVMDRLLFGSDYPASTPEETIRCLRNVNQAWPGGGAPRIPEDAIEAIITRPSLELLGLD